VEGLVHDGEAQIQPSSNLVKWGERADASSAIALRPHSIQLVTDLAKTIKHRLESLLRKLEVDFPRLISLLNLAKE
jgi:hypothetical protein